MLKGDAAWESFDVIRRLSGDDIERAKYYLEDATFLLELEPTATHYEVCVQA